MKNRSIKWARYIPCSIQPSFKTFQEHVRHSLESTSENCDFIGPPVSLINSSSVLLLSLPNVKSPLHSLDIALLARKKTVRVRIYGQTYLYRTCDITNPHYIERFFISLGLICLKNVCTYRSILNQFLFPLSV